jgi:hypothetical protein
MRSLGPFKPLWFAQIFGFEEASFEETRKYLQHKSIFPEPATDPLTKKPLYMYRRYETKEPIIAGTFETPSIRELRALVELELARLTKLGLNPASRKEPTLDNISGSARDLHTTPEFTGAVFQAASQFNCLEFSSPHTTPEAGVTGYCHDLTQGPACAMSAAAGLLYRQYSIQMPDGRLGQTADNQLNLLGDVELYVKERFGSVPWIVRNGYVEATSAADMERFNSFVDKHSECRQEIRDRLRIGVQWNTQVTADYDHKKAPYFVTQTFNSAISVGYSALTLAQWERFARLVLEGSYEATMLVGLLNNASRLQNHLPVRPVLLTCLGGGVFQNEESWIQGAMKYSKTSVGRFGLPLECLVVHHGAVENSYKSFVASV